MKMKKIRLSKRFLEGVLQQCQRYDSCYSREVIVTPIIMKTPCWGGKYYIYQRRICFHVGWFKYYGRFRGKAPIEKAFTLEQFMNSFYAVADEEPEMYIFKYYRK